MSLAEELEDINNGQYRDLNDLYETLGNGNGDYDELLKLIDHSDIRKNPGGGGTIEVDREYALNKIYGPTTRPEKAKYALGRAREGFENIWENIASNSYEEGTIEADRKIEELGDRFKPDDAWTQIKKQANSKENWNKANEAAMAAGTTGTAVGYQTGSLEIGLPSSLLTAGTIVKQGKLQGSRDKFAKEAAEGWDKSKGHYQVDIV